MVEEKQITAEDQVAFNMSLQLITHIFELMKQADYYRARNNHRKEFETLQTIKFNFIQSLSEKERQKLLSKEKSMHYYLLADHYSVITDKWTCNAEPPLTERQTYALKKLFNSGKLPSLIDEYRVSIMDLLEEKGFLVKKLSDLKVMF